MLNLYFGFVFKSKVLKILQKQYFLLKCFFYRLLQVNYDNVDIGTSADDDDFVSDVDGSLPGVSLKHRLLCTTVCCL
jgi:hypothetical protein